MLLWIVILGIIGLVLVIAEAFIPGFGIFGIAGSIALISSTVIAGIKYGFGVFLIMVATFIILQDMQAKKGISITTIQPYGKMEVEGIQIDVRSEGGYIEKNKMIEIIQVKGKTVVVKEVN